MYSQISKQGFRRRLLFNLHIKGGLNNPDRIQKLEGWFYEATLDKNPKIEMNFAIGSEKLDTFIENPSSLRFEEYQPMKALIFHLMKGSIILAKREGKITAKNYEYYLQKDIDQLKEYYKEMI